MKTPIFVRSFSEEEREALQGGLRSKNTFTLRRCQVLLASSRGEYAPRIAESLGCGQQTVRDAIHDFNERGLDALVARSSRPKRTRDAFDEEGATVNAATRVAIPDFGMTPPQVGPVLSIVDEAGLELDLRLKREPAIGEAK